MRGLLFGCLLACLNSTLLAAQDPLEEQSKSDRGLVISTVVDAISLSVYRDPGTYNSPIDKDRPTGYALISETRTVALPAGEFLLRFEGVADGMFPESAIVSGLPEGVREKNRDARLLSPLGLVDANLKRSVRISRTNAATGVVTEMDAVITAAPNGAVTLKTKEGYEAWQCTGLPERMLFDEVPADLSAKPTLSVIATSAHAVSAKITLTYLAEGFDWQANYLATIRSRAEDGETKVDLFAWLTLANGSTQSFVAANTMAVAGMPNRAGRTHSIKPLDVSLGLDCWLQARTHQSPDYPITVSATQDDGELTDQTVIGFKITGLSMLADEEQLGDLKLYRIPELVTVNANGQKQVALMAKTNVRFKEIYKGYFGMSAGSDGMQMTLRTENHVSRGLGFALPRGLAEIFDGRESGRFWLGGTALHDHAVGENLEIVVLHAENVRMDETELLRRRKFPGEGEGVGEISSWRIKLSNARDVSVDAEVEFPYELSVRHAKLISVDGMSLWRTKIPANGEVSIDFVVEETVEPVAQLTRSNYRD